MIKDTQCFENLIRNELTSRIEEIIAEESEAAKARVEKRTRELVGLVCESVLKQIKITTTMSPMNAEVQFVVRLPL